MSTRNLGDPGAADKLFEVASDEDRPLRLRREAILSFAHLRDTGIGERLYLFSEKEKNRDLSRCASDIFWNFF